MIMVQQGRSKQGKFLSKSEDNRHVRSIRLTDAVWNKLGEISESQNLTRADFLEQLVKSDIVNFYNRVIELEVEISKLKSVDHLTQDNCIYLSDESLLKVNKAASIWSITRHELIDKLVNSDSFKQITTTIKDNQVTITKLAKSMNVDPKTIRDYRDGKRNQSLVEWSRTKTLDGKGWEYDPLTKLYFQVD